MISVCFQSKLFNIMAIQVYALITNAVEAEVEWFPSKSGKLCVFIGNRHRKLFLMCQVNILFLPLVTSYTVVISLWKFICPCDKSFLCLIEFLSNISYSPWSAYRESFHLFCFKMFLLNSPFWKTFSMDRDFYIDRVIFFRTLKMLVTIVLLAIFLMKNLLSSLS